MSTSTLYFLVILIAVLAVLVVLWLIRSRGNTTGRHIDTSVTAIGAATEAIEDAVERIADRIEGAMATEEPAPLPPAPPAPPPPSPPPPSPPPPPSGGPDDLRRMKGIGPKLAALLTDLHITRFDQIAAWTDADIATIDAKLGAFKGRPARDNWVEQAGFLASGDIAGFEARFGKLGSAG